MKNSLILHKKRSGLFRCFIKQSVSEPKNKPDNENRCSQNNYPDPLLYRQWNRCKEYTSVLHDDDLNYHYGGHNDEECRISSEELRHLSIKCTTVDPVPDCGQYECRKKKPM